MNVHQNQHKHLCGWNNWKKKLFIIIIIIRPTVKHRLIGLLIQTKFKNKIGECKWGSLFL